MTHQRGDYDILIPLMLRKPNILFRLVAISIVIAFLWQDIAWAYPGITERTTLAQQTLLTAKDKSESFERVVFYHIWTTIHRKNAYLYTLNTVKEKWWPAILRAADEKELGEDERPVLSKDSDISGGVIKIVSPSGLEIAFYNPNIPAARKRAERERRPDYNRFVISVSVRRRGDIPYPAHSEKEYLRVQFLLRRLPDAASGFVPPPADIEYKKGRFGKVKDRKLRNKGYRYYMIQGGKKRYFHFRWNIFASLDDQILGNIEEREWWTQSTESIKKVQDSFEAAIS